MQPLVLELLRHIQKKTNKQDHNVESGEALVSANMFTLSFPLHPPSWSWCSRVSWPDREATADSKCEVATTTFLKCVAFPWSPSSLSMTSRVGKRRTAYCKPRAIAVMESGVKRCPQPARTFWPASKWSSRSHIQRDLRHVKGIAWRRATPLRYARSKCPRSCQSFLAKPQRQHQQIPRFEQ